jgi:transposase
MRCGLPACGLINASFVPEELFQELRSLSRKQLGREQTRHVQRIHKALIEANIRLDQVICDIMGASGRRIIEAMIAGIRDPSPLAALASKQVKATTQQLHDALHGRLTDHHASCSSCIFDSMTRWKRRSATSMAKSMRRFRGSTSR